MAGINFEWPHKFIQQNMVCMCLYIFRHDLSTTFMPHTLEGLKDLYIMAHDIVIQLNKGKNNPKESSGSIGRLLFLAITP